jgi:hypothetical protein
MKSVLTKMLAAAAILIGVGTLCVCRAADAADRVDVSFEYRRQSGPGSNQFAIGVENAGGTIVKTLFVTDFTAGRGGWKIREQSLPQWVASSDIANMSSREVDVVTGATPAPGKVTLSWDCRDKDGAPVPSGEYTLVLEATLRGENRVLYRTPVVIGGTAKVIAPEPRYFGPDNAERGMIEGVSVNYAR